MNKKSTNMLQYVTYITQFGLSVAFPPILCIMGAVWLQNHFSLGDWVLFAGIALGIGGGLNSFYEFVKYVQKQANKPDDKK